MNINELPVPIKHLLHKKFPEEDFFYAAVSDLTMQQNFGEEYLILTHLNIATFSFNGHSAELLSSYNLADISKLKSANLVGSGVIEIETEGTSYPIITYSLAKKKEFSWFVEAINDFLEKKHFPRDGKDRGTITCASCGFSIPDDFNKCPYCVKKSKTFKRILITTIPYIKQHFLIFITLIAGTCFGLITPYLSKVFIDDILKPDPATKIFEHAHWLPYAVAALLVAYMGQQFFKSLYMRVAGYLGHKTVYDVRSIIYRKLQELSLSYFDKHQTGGLMARVNQDTTELQYILVDFIPLTLESLFILFGVGIFLFVLSWQLTLFILIPIIAAVIFIKNIYHRVLFYFRRYYHRRAQLNALVNDSLSGMRVIKAFGQEKEEIEKFDNSSVSYRDAGIDVQMRWSLYQAILELFIMTGAVIVWAVGGRLVIFGNMTVGSLVAYTGYLMMFYRPVFTLTRMIERITNSLSAAERIFEVIDTKPEIEDAPDAIKMPDIKGAIEFKQVTFGYDPFEPVIHDMSIKIQPNETIGLVGKSGAGKSTIINLICRLYDTNSGEITIDGTNIKKIKTSDLRHQIGVVLQETFLFNGTIFDNIIYAKPDATIKTVIEAAIAANAHEFIIKKPDGYDTMVGEGGVRLSGGEKQRIAIARAILRNPRILILDEATSSLDTETEEKIQQSLRELTKGRTTIAIAHRLSTLRNCHRLLVIEDGHLKEIGSHTELMKKKGIFHKLVKIQNESSKIIAVNG
jgi:ATP-binding cassette, subfamily B, bacterial